MPKLNHIPHAQYIFGSLFALANRVDTLLDRALQQYNISSKQWFLSICIANLFDQDPTLKEAAKVNGSSYQNIKQVALKLQEKNLLELYKDPHDARTTRMRLTNNSIDFWMSTAEDSQIFMDKVFKNISDEEMLVVRNVFDKLSDNLSEMEKVE